MKSNKLTLKTATALLSEMGFSLRKRDGEFRVNIHNGAEETAYYTDDIQDAVDTAKHMATLNVGTAKTDADLNAEGVAKLQAAKPRGVAFAEVAEAVRNANRFEKTSDINGRNLVARVLFSYAAYRTILGADGSTVETWFDRQSKNYVTQTKDAAGNEMVAANYTGHKHDAAVAHVWALFRYL